MNRWIIGINMFHFDLVHVLGEHHTPNGLSRRPAQPGDVPAEDDEEEPVGLLFSFTHTIGAALWAAQLEAQVNIIENQAVPQGKKKVL